MYRTLHAQYLRASARVSVHVSVHVSVFLSRSFLCVHMRVFACV